ncbi:hypothetical protein D3C84_637280 [compost metagenome]
MLQYPAQAIGNRQAQAQAFFGAGLVAVEAFELFENHLQLVIRNAGATVPYFEQQAPRFVPHTQQNRAFAVAKGIGEEVLQDAAQQFHVAVDPQATAA